MPALLRLWLLSDRMSWAQRVSDTLVSKPGPVEAELQPGRRFFGDIRRRTVFAYYTSKMGILEELDYKGKTPLPEWVGCLHPEHRDEDTESGDAV